MDNEKSVVVERESVMHNGQTEYKYFAVGIVRGRPVKACIAPMDKGGYVLLDIIFSCEGVPSVVARQERHKERDMTFYYFRNVDADGKPYECDVRPMFHSDRVKLNVLFRGGGAV